MLRCRSPSLSPPPSLLPFLPPSPSLPLFLSILNFGLGIAVAIGLQSPYVEKYNPSLSSPFSLSFLSLIHFNLSSISHFLSLPISLSPPISLALSFSFPLPPSPSHRMQSTWVLVDPKLGDVIMSVKEKFSPMKNFTEYRKLVADVEAGSDIASRWIS